MNGGRSHIRVGEDGGGDDDGPTEGVIPLFSQLPKTYKPRLETPTVRIAALETCILRPD